MNHDENNESKPEMIPDFGGGPDRPAPPQRKKSAIAVMGALMLGGLLSFERGGRRPEDEVEMIVPPAPPEPPKKKKVRVNLKKMPVANLVKIVTDYAAGKFEEAASKSEKDRLAIEAFVAQVGQELSTRPGYRKRATPSNNARRKGGPQ